MTKILVFTEGTLLMHSTGRDVSREQRVRQSASDAPEVKDFATYIPVGFAVAKLKDWQRQGADIYYMTSRISPAEVDVIRGLLQKYGFPYFEKEDHLLYRKGSEAYKDVATALMPTVLIEDDCESIGGQSEMTYPNMSPEIQSYIHSIVVKEFEGIDHLPDAIEELSR